MEDWLINYYEQTDPLKRQQMLLENKNETMSEEDKLRMKLWEARYGKGKPRKDMFVGYLMNLKYIVAQQLKKTLSEKGYSTGVGDEGGFAPDLDSAQAALEILQEATTLAGYEPGEDIFFAMDAAASELYDENTKRYYFPGESRMREKEICRNAEEMVQYYEELVEQFPLISIEDGLSEEDYAGWKVLTYRLGEKVQLVGDDLFVTNVKRLSDGIEKGIANAILIKPNQIGTLSETLDAILMAQKEGYRTIISHRSGDTEDTTIADLAVAVNAGQIKTGAPCRAERTAKYNQLMRIEEELGNNGSYGR